ncbi:MAG: tRNA lysidine(34) synthetase TilS [Planctomycetes bacterium]|nr:tRNA lysidine(34) synthetase TilS [Planctomycetota bacterium]
MNSSCPLSHQIAAFFQRHGLEGSAGVVALSGGPDSVALAWLLRSLVNEGHLTRLVLAHVNHQLRGAESDGDEGFVLELAKTWNIPCRSTRIDTPSRAKGDNLESLARGVRYSFLTQIAQEDSATWIATGHTADDQAETVLFRIVRGSGLHGLAGIPERRRAAEGIDVIRPLLHTTRSEIALVLKQNGLSFRVDRSNEDLSFTRNRLRHELLPLLKTHFNPAVVEVLGRLAEQAREVQNEIRARTETILQTVELPRAGGMLVFSAAGLAAALSFWRREVFRLAWQRENWPMGEMNFEDWQRLADLVDGGPSAIDLAGGMRVRRVGKVIQIGRIV